ncbi:uncharacterized protein [Rutidosis leptorrhynchoides]|uniref:uncharacterized protein n=1 Tax=Rutidosis leptorrhynchoides TaxID=125765 RepID=UPI003A99F62E
MGRNSPPRHIDDNGGDGAAAGGFRPIRDRFPFKRNPNSRTKTSPPYSDRTLPRSSSGGGGGGGGRSYHTNRLTSHRKGLNLLFSFRGVYFFYIMVILGVFAFASMVLQSSMISSVVFRQGPEKRGRSVMDGLRIGSTLRFVPGQRLKSITAGHGLDQLRSQPRIGIRKPRLAIVLGSMKKDANSLMLITVMNNLQKIGYFLKIYVVKDGPARSMWEQISGVSLLGPELHGHIDWSRYEGVIVNSLEAKDAISSLMQDPFHTVPLVWIIQEDTLANRLQIYEEMGWKHLIFDWEKAFSRATVVAFPDYTLPMLYSLLDTGNFFVIPGSPVDVWAAEAVSETHSKDQLRKNNGFNEDDLVVLVVGSSFFYDELSWDYAVAMHTIAPLLIKHARRKDAGGSFKFIFLSGNSSDGYDDALQDLASRLGLLEGSLRHYGVNSDANHALLMADIVLYGSSQDEQGFPSLIIRAMAMGVPVVAPEFPIIKKYVGDGVHAILFREHDPDALMNSFSLIISDGKLSEIGQVVASHGKLLAKDLLASECITGYARLLENVLDFPSTVLLPSTFSEIQQMAWNWNYFGNEIDQKAGEMLDADNTEIESSIVYALEKNVTKLLGLTNVTENATEVVGEDLPTDQDWAVLGEMESLEEYERLEMEELEDRNERNTGAWDEIYKNAKKAEKLNFELNERDEGELERTGQPVCIYEIYVGRGTWQFLHHGSLYRGLSLSTNARRLRSDDVDAVGRLPLLNDSYYRDILCEIGGMFAVANKVDKIHRRPWIGFQSWRATGKKASLSKNAEKFLEDGIQNSKDVIYFWTQLDLDGGSNNDRLTFWSMCDILNGGHCRTAFQDAFRRMYDLPASVEALPPMPEDGGRWSSLHSWVMPTPSFLEFIMFSRMFVDSLHILHAKTGEVDRCLLSSSKLESKHCYCRMMELLVNVWAYHSARKMVYINPQSGILEEQHPIENRKGFIWAKYFNFTLLKTMDEDLAEAADDGDHPTEKWLWPLTGEVHWQGIYEREREERYRLKMDKKRKTKEKLLERLRNGYKQKSLGRRSS